MNSKKMKKRYWQFYFINPKKYQMIPEYQYIEVKTEPNHEYDNSAFEKDYKASDYPQEKYLFARNIEIIEK